MPPLLRHRSCADLFDRVLKRLDLTDYIAGQGGDLLERHLGAGLVATVSIDSRE